MNPPTPEEIALAADIMRRIRTPARTEANRRNAATATAARVARQTLKPCNCGRQEGHASACPVYQREAARRRKERQKK